MGWIGLMWMRIRTRGGLLWTRLWTSGFHKMLGSSWVAAQLAASQEGLSSMSEWVIYMKFGMYIMAPVAMSAVCFINPSHQSVCISLLSLLGIGSVKCIPHLVRRQRLGKHVPVATNTRNNRIVVLVILCALRVLSQGSLWICIPLPLLGNNSLKTFSLQRRNFGGVVFYAIRAVSEESRRLVSSKTFCFLECRLSVCVWMHVALDNTWEVGWVLFLFGI
jgi:hypothetical protein